MMSGQHCAFVHQGKLVRARSAARSEARGHHSSIPELSATLPLPDYGRVARHPTRIGHKYERSQQPFGQRNNFQVVRCMANGIQWRRVILWRQDMKASLFYRIAAVLLLLFDA